MMGQSSLGAGVLGLRALEKSLALAKVGSSRVSWLESIRMAFSGHLRKSEPQ